ncbi:MAG TPA: malonyl-ACP O-methyltransferase BioC [Gammaproteobacteria bacterium]
MSGRRQDHVAESPALSYRLDKKQVRAAFQRAARSYDTAARVQRELADRLLEHLEPVRITPAVVVDVGAGTGDLAARLTKRFSGALVLALDIADHMLRVARGKSARWFSKQRFVCADAEALPLADASVDLLISNATLQWCNELEDTFTECARVLKPGGLLMFSSFGPDTLIELRRSFEGIDGRPHVHAFMDMHDLGDALLRGGFADVVMDSARLTANYENVGELLHELKSIGATNALSTRQRGLTGKRRLAQLTQAYETFRTDNQLPATYEAVFAHAWKPAPGARSVSVSAPVR